MNAAVETKRVNNIDNYIKQVRKTKTISGLYGQTGARLHRICMDCVTDSAKNSYYC